MHSASKTLVCKLHFRCINAVSEEEMLEVHALTTAWRITGEAPATLPGAAAPCEGVSSKRNLRHRNLHQNPHKERRKHQRIFPKTARKCRARERAHADRMKELRQPQNGKCIRLCPQSSCLLKNAPSVTAAIRDP